MNWTPYELGILLHYYCRAEEHEHAPIFESTIDKLISAGLMRHGIRQDDLLNWALTDCGKAFIELGLLQTQVPIQVWTMPVKEQL